MIAPRYMYASRRLFADVGAVLTDLVGERGTITEKEKIPGLVGAPSLDYIITNKQGIEIGSVQVIGVVSYSLNDDLTDVGNSLDNRYSADKVSELTQGFAQEHDQLCDDLHKKLEALPTEWIRDIPDLAKYDGPLQQYTGGHVLQFNKIIQDDHHAEWVMELLKIGKEELQSVRGKIKVFLGDEVLAAERRIYSG